jgi:hypothetical protein
LEPHSPEAGTETSYQNVVVYNKLISKVGAKVIILNYFVNFHENITSGHN